MSVKCFRKVRSAVMASGIEAVGSRREGSDKELYRNSLLPRPFLANIMVRTSEVL